MSAHTSKRREKARVLAKEIGCQVKVAIRKIAVKENSDSNKKAEYEVSKGAWV